MLSLGAVIMLAILAIVGFLPDDPGSNALRLLLVPAALFGASYALLRRTPGEPSRA